MLLHICWHWKTQYIGLREKNTAVLYLYLHTFQYDNISPILQTSSFCLWLKYWISFMYTNWPLPLIVYLQSTVKIHWLIRNRGQSNKIWFKQLRGDIPLSHSAIPFILLINLNWVHIYKLIKQVYITFESVLV